MTNEQTLYKITKVIWYVFYVLEALLLFRFALKLLGANAGAGFTSFIYTLTAVPLAPFRLVFPPDTVGGAVFEWSTLLAILVYAALAWGIVKLLMIGRPVSRTEASFDLRAQDEA